MATHRARAGLQPLDVVLKRSRAYTLLRRASLAASLALTVGVPLWHLRSLEAPSVPPVLGPPGAVSVLGVELLDPLAIVSVALSGQLTAKLALLALPALALVVVLGRFFCGWVCPYVPLLAATQAVRWGLRRAGVPLLDLRLPRRTATVAMVGLLAASAAGVQLWPLAYPPSVIGREVFRAVFFGGFGAGAALVAFALAFDTFVSRAGFCRSLCPGGAMFSWLSRRSPITVALDRAACTGCTACDVVCNLGQSPMTAAVDEGCERCGKCIAACPTSALRFRALPRGGR